MRKHLLPALILLAAPAALMAQSTPSSSSGMASPGSANTPQASDSQAPGDPSTMGTANSSSDMSPGQSATTAQTGNSGDDHSTPAKKMHHRKKKPS